MTASRASSVVVLDPDALRRSGVARRILSLGLDCRAHAAPPPVPVPAIGVVLLLQDVCAAPLASLRIAFPFAKIVAGATDPSQEAAVRAFRAGADDFLWLGGADAELRERLAAMLDASIPQDEEHGGLIGISRVTRELREMIRRVAPSNATVLVSGETGTGKDCAALMLHRLSRRAGGPLVALNCAAIPEALLEGELFGYERGAFSGALSAFPGRLKLADGGTLFLDEIGELSLVGQAKILRAIETREAWRLGARSPTRFDVRIVAASNRDLLAETQAGRFRLDLFYRIAVAQLRLPPLRDRPEDVAPIACHILAELAGDGVAPRLEDTALRRLEAHAWPGNVRELRNVLEVALVTSSAGRIRATDLNLPDQDAPAAPPRAALEQERERLQATLARCGGNKKLAAQALNCSRMTLYRRLARCGLAEEEAPTRPVSRAMSHPVSQALSREA